MHQENTIELSPSLSRQLQKWKT